MVPTVIRKIIAFEYGFFSGFNILQFISPRMYISNLRDGAEVNAFSRSSSKQFVVVLDGL